jgi:hypothetical protein
MIITRCIDYIHKTQAGRRSYIKPGNFHTSYDVMRTLAYLFFYKSKNIDLMLQSQANLMQERCPNWE